MNNEDIRILVVDDEFSVRDSLQLWFRQDGYQVKSAESAIEALRVLQEWPADIVLLDIRMPGMDGLELQRRIRDINPDIAVIMITAFASVETAVEALKEGAFDYITKPVDPDELSHVVQHASEKKRLRTENAQLREKIEEMIRFDEIIGDSPSHEKVLELVRNVAATDSTVLIRGESGTGKELIAKAVHINSNHRYFPIVPVNCGALTETLLESELFGHEKGAFTGAQFKRKGKLEMADGGTLFLDEIGTISLKMQIDLLRVLETRTFTRVGGSKPISVNFRVVCATNQNLEDLVKQGTFREDLYYRINVFSILLPPLRERRADIPILARYFLDKYCLQMGKHITQISADALDAMVQHDWPGNVRELANAIERALVVGSPPAITLQDLPFQHEPPRPVPAGDSLAELEKLHILEILNREEWNISRTAQLLGIDRATLYNKVKKYNLRQAKA